MLILIINYRITHDNASSNLTLMAEFVKYYKEKFNIEFISDIPCAAHVINLIINDIMAELKLKAPKNDEIAIYIEDMEKVLKKKKSGRNTPDLPGKFNSFIYLLLFLLIFYL